MKSSGQPRPPAFDGYKSFAHDDLTAKHFHFSYSRPPDVDGIKSFDRDDQSATKNLIPTTSGGLEHLK